MTIPYKDVLLWGHSLADFKQMFDLDENDLHVKILDCCGGPNSFNAELTEQGGQVISCDPLFSLPLDELRKKIEKDFAQLVEVANPRKKNIELFLNDYTKGKEEGRYQACALPSLSFQHFEFDLAVCSHYLFAYCPEQSVAFHVSAITELCNAAKEVRIFPLLDSKGEIPRIVGPILKELNQREHGVEIKAVPYEFQKRGNAMLRVWAQICEV